MLLTPRLGVIEVDELTPLLDRPRVLAAVRDALIAHACGRVLSPPPTHLSFPEARGDCHVKCGHASGDRWFVIKVATGFYDNPSRDLAVNNGFVAMLDSHTGALMMLIKDHGWLTAWRTAAAVALAAAVFSPLDAVVGIIGTGLQAKLAVEWLELTLSGARYVVWGRDVRKADHFSTSLARPHRQVCTAATIDELLDTCRIVVTATPSTMPLFADDAVKPGTHIVGVGADTAGKQELPAALFGRAAHVITDDRTQCLDHGDFGNAVRSGAVAATAAVVLGDVLSRRVLLSRAPEDITIVDLTGIAAQDIAIAGVFFQQLRDARLQP